MKKAYNSEEALGNPSDNVGVTEAIQKEAKGQELPPRLKKEMSGYKTILTKLMHSPKKQEVTMELLSAGPPQISVPNAALTINQEAEMIMEKKGIKISQASKLAGSVFLVSDLIELGNASGVFGQETVDEQEAQLIYQDTLQDYIQRGLKDKTIDPMELQQQVEPLMTQEQKAVGMKFAQGTGVPMKPTSQQVIGNQKGMLEGGQG